VFVFHVVNDDGVVVFGFSRTLEEPAAAGRRIRLAGEIENRLVPGRYFLDCWIRRHRASGDMALQPLRLCSFLIFGTTPPHGVVSLRADVEPVLEPGP
jgi:hypothetical protein